MTVVFFVVYGALLAPRGGERQAPVAAVPAPSRPADTRAGSDIEGWRERMRRLREEGHTGPN